jgi:hypothetical protein
MKRPSVEPRDRERFLAALAEQVPIDRVVELYLFQPMRQGGVESGVAVIAAAGDEEVAAGGTLQADGAESGGIGHATDDSEAVPATPIDGAAAQADGVPADADEAAPRYTVFTARYRHVLKGPERGRWEVSVVAEADAPLAAVGAVVRGVQRRAGDAEPPEHITGDALRDALGQGPPAGP